MPDIYEPAPLWALRLHRFRTGRLSGTPYIYQPSAPEGHFHVAHLDDAAAACGHELERRGRILAAAPALLNAAEALLRDWDSPSLSDETPIKERFDALRNAVMAARVGAA